MTLFIHSRKGLRHSREGGNPQNPQPNVNLRSLVQPSSMDSRLRGNDVVRASEYQLTQSLPENLQSQLPSVEEIEQELGGEL